MFGMRNFLLLNTDVSVSLDTYLGVTIDSKLNLIKILM